MYGGQENGCQVPLRLVSQAEQALTWQGVLGGEGLPISKRLEQIGGIFY